MRLGMQSQIFRKFCVRHDPDLLFEITQIDAGARATGSFPGSKPPHSAAQQTGDIHVQSSVLSKNRAVGRFAKLYERLTTRAACPISSPAFPAPRVRDCRMPKENGQEGKRLRRRIIYRRLPPLASSAPLTEIAADGLGRVLRRRVRQDRAAARPSRGI
jgi:hypothetical protein